jgi:large subunit ribosomal protein L21
MNEYAIVKIGNRQYIVEADKTYTVDKFAAEAGSKMKLEVLAHGNGDKLNIGTPVLDKASVEIEIIEQGKGEKVTTRNFRAKSRYRKTTGIRKQTTTFKVTSIK